MTRASDQATCLLRNSHHTGRVLTNTRLANVVVVQRHVPTQRKGSSKVRPCKAIGCKCRCCIDRVLVGEVKICTQTSGPMSVVHTASTKKVKIPASLFESSEIELCHRMSATYKPR
jgi:hypothetical protein